MAIFSATMSRALTDSMSEFSNKILNDAIERLAAKYGFDVEEATDFLMGGGVHVKLPPLEKSKLPWCGTVDGACCKAIVKNGGLFTQCTSSPLDGGWCKKCAKDVEKNGTPTNGDVEARLVGDIMVYKIGNTEVKPYIDYMIKNNITREQAEESAATYGLTIDPRQFEKKKRGRKQAAPRTMAPAVESPQPGEMTDELSLEVLTETVVSTDLPALHRERAAAAVAAAPVAPDAPADADPEEVEDDKPLTIKEINGMKKDDLHRVCATHGISIDGKDILTLKKELKAKVIT
jgi:hypothetical protein